ncbi:MAG TPA: type II toxin-antitoxin system VapC family toxin [Thermoanaerobaculia bacterium]|nr:type II toxin-antitoxin system VapC family toxin [Thermoanaerobaculia bacterium]
MTARYLLDTSIVSSPVSKIPSPEVAKRLEKHAHESAIAAPVWHELLFGCDRLPPGKRRTTLEAYLRDVIQASLQILAYDEAAARWHARERVRLEKLGRPAPYADGQIAAIARVNDLILVTANARDFAHFHELAVEDWSKR